MLANYSEMRSKLGSGEYPVPQHHAVLLPSTLCFLTQGYGGNSKNVVTALKALALGTESLETPSSTLEQLCSCVLDPKNYRSIERRAVVALQGLQPTKHWYAKDLSKTPAGRYFYNMMQDFHTLNRMAKCRLVDFGEIYLRDWELITKYRDLQENGTEVRIPSKYLLMSYPDFTAWIGTVFAQNSKEDVISCPTETIGAVSTR